jgi:hypothetical protein
LLRLSQLKRRTLDSLWLDLLPLTKSSRKSRSMKTNLLWLLKTRLKFRGRNSDVKDNSVKNKNRLT